MPNEIVPRFRISQTIAAAPEAVFDAWVTPNTMRKWMFATGKNDIYKAQSDLRVGGSYSVLEWNGGEHIDHFGHYEEVDRPRRLVFTLSAPKHFPQRTLVTVAVNSTAAGSNLAFDQVGVGRDMVEAAWRVMFNTLAKQLGDTRSATERNVEVY
jgi:uncharacterized protein YndB with AHSA1/START domain